MNKNNAIVLWRVLFTYVIMFFHFDNKYSLTSDVIGNNGWYIGVEFFFLVSGFLLYYKLEERKNIYSTGLMYLKRRIGQIYPLYFASYVLSFLCLWVCSQWTFKEAAWNGGTHIFEMLALQGAGLNMGWNCINNTGWFISVLLITEFLLYHCLTKWKDTTCDFIIPIVILVIFSFLYRTVNGISASPLTTGFYENWALMRGLLDMSAGVCAARLCCYLKDKGKNVLALRVLGHIGMIAVLVGSFFLGYTEMDFVYLIILTFSVAFCFLPSNCRLYKSELLQKWGSITLSMYLIHDMFRTSLFPKLFGFAPPSVNKWILLVLYMFIVTVLAVPFKVGVKALVASLNGRGVHNS